MSQRATTKAVIARKMLPKCKEEVGWCELRVPEVDVADMDVLVFATEVPEEEREEVAAMDDAMLETPEFEAVDCTSLDAVSVVLDEVPVAPDGACDVEECWLEVPVSNVCDVSDVVLAVVIAALEEVTDDVIRLDDKGSASVSRL